MTAIDRMSPGYEPRWDLDLEVGTQGVLFTGRISDAVRDGRAEIKTDEKALLTGNVFIEYQCQYRGTWRNSGIVTTQAEIWCHVTGEGMIAAPVTRVRHIAAFFYALGRIKPMDRGAYPTMGVVIPIGVYAEKLAKGLTPGEERRLARGPHLPKEET